MRSRKPIHFLERFEVLRNGDKHVLFLFTLPGSAAIHLKRGGSKSRLGHNVIARFDGQSASTIQVHVQQLPIALHGSSGNKDRIDIAGIRTRGGIPCCICISTAVAMEKVPPVSTMNRNSSSLNVLQWI